MNVTIEDVIVFLAGCGAAWLLSFLREKGKNLATKEDVAEITTLIKKAEQPFTLALQKLEHQNQLRLAVLKDRFEAHQEAWSLWLELLWSASSRDAARLGKATSAAQDFLTKRALYLEPHVRDELHTSVGSANMIHELLSPGGSHDADELNMLKAHWKRLHGTGSIISEAVGLPSIRDTEFDAMQKEPTVRP